MRRIVCWLRGHVWRECPIFVAVPELGGGLLAIYGAQERCRGACEWCGKQRGEIVCIICERVAS